MQWVNEVLIAIAYEGHAIAGIIGLSFGKDQELHVGIVGIGLFKQFKTNRTVPFG